MELVIFQWWHPDVRPDHQRDAYWDDMIHKEDLRIAYDFKFPFSIFKVMGEQGSFIIIKHLNCSLRVKKECLKYIKDEGFYIGDKVELISKDCSNIVKKGIIHTLTYHYQQERLYYYLTDLDNKKLKKRYLSDDLQKAS
ncbi:MAG: hypothetical protein WBP45_07595 [Daejeonella sp.]